MGEKQAKQNEPAADIAMMRDISAGREVAWANPRKLPAEQARSITEQRFGSGMTQIEEAEARLERFAPFIMARFPETQPQAGIIESELVAIPAMQAWLNSPQNGARLSGRLLLKRDSDLAIAGSVKARGGIYEVLHHAEELALEHGLLGGINDDYACLASDKARAFFSNYTVQVGSTGNLGLSIGIASAAVGFHAVVHMSMDAKQWKKDLLRARGVEVIEYAGDYQKAVAAGRERSDANPSSYFVDDENSRDLFMGYAVAALRLARQLNDLGISVSEASPLFTYIPCGVGGAPGGISFGIKQVFGDAAHCFFVEPTQAPCMLLGLVTGKYSDICVQDVGLSGRTDADGLAVGRQSGFVGRLIEPFLSGEFTVEDSRLPQYTRALWNTERIFVEPSAAAAFQGPARIAQVWDTCNAGRVDAGASAPVGNDAGAGASNGLAADSDALANATHIVWATGGSLVPGSERARILGES
jgi:D-serine dehydratase